MMSVPLARRSRLDEPAPELRPLLASIGDHINAWNAKPDLAMQVLDEYANVGDAAVLKKTYDFYTKQTPYEPTLQPTLPGIKAMMDFLSGSVPKVGNYK